jgi:hypothetical protein
VSPVKYELGFYIPEDDILHSDRRENLKSYMHFSCFMFHVSIRIIINTDQQLQDCHMHVTGVHTLEPRLVMHYLYLDLASCCLSQQ